MWCSFATICFHSQLCQMFDFSSLNWLCESLHNENRSCYHLILMSGLLVSNVMDSCRRFKKCSKGVISWSNRGWAGACLSGNTLSLRYFEVDSWASGMLHIHLDRNEQRTKPDIQSLNWGFFSFHESWQVCHVDVTRRWLRPLNSLKKNNNNV